MRQEYARVLQATFAVSGNFWPRIAQDLLVDFKAPEPPKSFQLKGRERCSGSQLSAEAPNDDSVASGSGVFLAACERGVRAAGTREKICTRGSNSH
jgi:hypothetical protein